MVSGRTGQGPIFFEASMANEITITAMIEYADSESAGVGLILRDLLANVATKKYVLMKQNIGIVEEALKLGEITSLGWAFFINRDATNYLELRVATAGIKFAKMLAGECALFRFGSGITAPFAISDTAACQLEYILVSL